MPVLYRRWWKSFGIALWHFVWPGAGQIWKYVPTVFAVVGGLVGVVADLAIVRFWTAILVGSYLLMGVGYAIAKARPGCLSIGEMYLDGPNCILRAVISYAGAGAVSPFVTIVGFFDASGGRAAENLGSGIPLKWSGRKDNDQKVELSEEGNDTGEVDVLWFAPGLSGVSIYRDPNPIPLPASIGHGPIRLRLRAAAPGCQRVERDFWVRREHNPQSWVCRESPEGARSDRGGCELSQLGQR